MFFYNFVEQTLTIPKLFSDPKNSVWKSLKSFLQHFLPRVLTSYPYDIDVYKDLHVKLTDTQAVEFDRLHKITLLEFKSRVQITKSTVLRLMK